MLIGTTFIPDEAQKRGIPKEQVLAGLSELRFQIVRLGAYWPEIQPQSNTWNFDELHRTLRWLHEHRIAVVVTVGMKAPRWPEYYLPRWLTPTSPPGLLEPTLKFIEKVVRELRGHPNIYAWQVENEPLDRGGKYDWAIPLGMLKEEISLVRLLDDRPIHLNFWGNNIIRRPDYQAAADLADIIGLDLYYRQPAQFGQYHGPYFWDWQLKWWIANQPKRLWITELQGDAWEKNHQHKWQPHPGSMNPGYLQANFNRALKLQPEAILFWGYEYWLWQKQQGRPELWDTAKALILQAQKSVAKG
jgi:hypothetical protein